MSRPAMLALLCIAGCAPAPRSQGYYERHPEETDRVLARCKISQDFDSTCEAAGAAKAKLDGERRRKLFRKGFK